MTMIRIIDSHALMVFLEKENGYKKVEQIFVNAIELDAPLLMTTVNYGEVYYIILRECGQEKLDEIEGIIRNLPIKIVDVDISIAREAAMLKATKRMSYADCFAAALTKIRKGELLTGDQEFKTLEKEIKISWLSEE